MATYKQNIEAMAAVLPQCLLDEFIDWIQSSLDPEDVFSETALQCWAERNGYEKG